jgi:hypothetical protein
MLEDPILSTQNSASVSNNQNKNEMLVPNIIKIPGEIVCVII